MRPFEQKPRAFEANIRNWDALYMRPYDKRKVDPYTRLRIILMNGIEVEAVTFGHAFHRNCGDPDLRRALSMIRRVEQQQQKTINWLSPGDESVLETTIGYEHLAVDLTAWLAKREPDQYVKAAMDFALLEDFDHLYRYANLLRLDDNIPAHKLVGDLIEITPGRPTISHHRHPREEVKHNVDAAKADIRTKLGALILTSAEQQTMNFYMNSGPVYELDHGRKLYQEIGMVEEQHVTQYGSLIDPNRTWLENLLMREYMEAYLYWSFSTSESDAQFREMWELYFAYEVSHLLLAKDLLQKHEGTSWETLVPAEFPDPLVFEPTKDYVRQVLASQANLTENLEEYAPIDSLPPAHEFFTYQKLANVPLAGVPSHYIIDMMQHASIDGLDYRHEDTENPVQELTDRTKDNTTIGRGTVEEGTV